MIDLSRKGLPNAIMGADGNPILLNTDYRIWIKFNQDLNSPNKEVNISYLFQDDENAPIIDDYILNQLKLFLYNPNPTPKSSDASNEKILDYIQDGEYIYSALYQMYGIDIIDTDMHWHKFLALCNNIFGETTLWGYAKSVRGYKKQSGKFDYEKQKQKEKQAWAFPIELTEEEQRKKDEFDEYFG